MNTFPPLQNILGYLLSTLTYFLSFGIPEL